jgi:hypothetical protein
MLSGLGLRNPAIAPVTSMAVAVPLTAGTVTGPKSAAVGAGGRLIGIVIVRGAPEFVAHGPDAT